MMEILKTVFQTEKECSHFLMETLMKEIYKMRSETDKEVTNLPTEPITSESGKTIKSKVLVS
jgi:hypothetical protein